MPARYRELYEEGRRLLEEVLPRDAALDARLLLEKACGTGLQTLLVYPDRTVDDAACERYRSMIGRRRLREPCAMILGEWEFMGLPFRVTKDTLIPEQDTEVLAETALRLWEEGRIPGSAAAAREGKGTGEERDRGPVILDLCTGSGCILLSLLHFMPGGTGIGTDISVPALATARENAGILGLTERTLFLQGDLWEALEELPQARQTMDLIVSNPPYVPTAVIGTLEPEVRCGEPYAALDGGPDGLVFYRRILEKAGCHLSPGGWLILETGFNEAASVRGMMANEGYTEIRVVRDYGGIDRVVAGRLRAGTGETIHV